MRSSCISYPEREAIIIIRRSQIDFCGGNTCAAALFSYFEYWHNIKIDMSGRNKAFNKMSAINGTEGYQDETLLQFHSMTELSEGIMGLYGISTIKTARKVLVDLGMITEHKNPSERYKFDRTIYYLFHPEVFSKWLISRFVENNDSNAENNDTSVENNDSSIENSGTITETSLESSLETSLDIKEVAASAKQKSAKKDTKQVKAKITSDWKPSERCFELIEKAGIDSNFALGLVDEFILYWDERGDKRNGWDAAFLGQVKRANERRSIYGNAASSTKKPSRMSLEGIDYNEGVRADGSLI